MDVLSTKLDEFFISGQVSKPILQAKWLGERIDTTLRIV